MWTTTMGTAYCRVRDPNRGSTFAVAGRRLRRGDSLGNTVSLQVNPALWRPCMSSAEGILSRASRSERDDSRLGRPSPLWKRSTSLRRLCDESDHAIVRGPRVRPLAGKFAIQYT